MPCLQEIIRASFVFFIFSCSLPAYAQNLEFEDIFDGMTELEIQRIYCDSVLDAEHDVVSKISSGLIGEIPEFCGVLFPEKLISANVEKLEEIHTVSTYGARYMERLSKWGVYNANSLITVKNPYPEKLLGISIAFREGGCRSNNEESIFRLTFKESIPAHETYIVSFDYSHLTTSRSNACIEIVDASPSALSDAGEGLSRAISLARAGQWSESGILIDLSRRSGAKTSNQQISELHDRVKKTVRALPASDAIRNRDGYDFLLALRPENSEYAERFERYQATSLPDRTRIVILDILSKAPVALPDQVFMELSERRTRAQREISWSSLKEKNITISGRVKNVRPTGLISNSMLQIETKRGFSALCYVKDFLNAAATSVNIGDQVSCTGKLIDYTLILDSLTISISDAEFIR